VEQIDYPCPACGFYTFDEPPGSYNDCAVCNWEDDAVQLRHPLMGGGANRDSLVAYQQKVLLQLPLGVQEYHGFKRDPLWVPFSVQGEHTSDVPQTGIDYFDHAIQNADGYYWRGSKA